MKKSYVKPSMTVHPMSQKPCILAGSDPKGYPGPFAYNPGQSADMA